MLDSILHFTSVIDGQITLTVFLLCTAVSLVLGVLTALVSMYRNRTSQSFTLALAILPTIVQVVIMLVNGNIGAGVAVAGAFSLVRFRSAAGSAREICAIFLAMAVGLATGMGYVSLAVVSFAVLASVLLLLQTLRFGEQNSAERTLKITIPESLDFDGLFDDLFQSYTKSATLEKVKTSNMGTLFELQYRIILNGTEIPKAFLDELRVRNGNLNIVCGKVAEKDAL